MLERRQADILLRQHPAENAPYLAPKGIAVFAATAACIVAGLVLWHVGFQDESIALVAAASVSFLITSADYTVAVIVWRMLRKNDVAPAVHIEAPDVREYASFSIALSVRNPALLPIDIAAVGLDHSAHIRTGCLAQRIWRIGAGAVGRIAFEARSMHAGKGAVRGVGLITVSPLRFFRSEAHIPLQYPVFVVPASVASGRAGGFHESVFGEAASRLMSMDPDGELETIRPYQHADPCRNISWRHYAKTGHLMVRQFSRSEQRSLVCLVDAGPQMRLNPPNCISNLSCAVGLIASSACAYASVTVIAYDEYAARMVVKNGDPARIHARLRRWMLDELEWHPPVADDADGKRIWNQAALQLCRDFKRYRHVDFSVRSGSEIRIDLKGLVDWAKADLALRDYENGDVEKARERMHVSYATMLTRLVRQRCSMPQSELMPNPPRARLYQAAELLGKIKGAPISLMWLSDFASDMSEEALERIASFIHKQRVSVLGVCLPMPEYALNFVASRGNVRRHEVMRKMSRHVEFLEHTPERPVTARAGEAGSVEQGARIPDGTPCRPQ